ncbi:zn-dependent hydrolase [Colletotrichum incanum]|nr:zn-dependent hydrolase [Colletotrichum incanum]
MSSSTFKELSDYHSRHHSRSCTEHQRHQLPYRPRLLTRPQRVGPWAGRTQRKLRVLLYNWRTSPPLTPSSSATRTIPTTSMSWADAFLMPAEFSLQPMALESLHRAWSSGSAAVGRESSKRLEIRTPCQHLPDREVTGFLLSVVEFLRIHGLPNAICISGYTVYLEELAQMREKFRIPVAILNVGAVKVAVTDPPLRITMDGNQAARLFREIGPDVLVPIHYESWLHFTENRAQFKAVFEVEGISHKVCWLKPGVPKKIM